MSGTGFISDIKKTKPYFMKKYFHCVSNTLKKGIKKYSYHMFDMFVNRIEKSSHRKNNYENKLCTKNKKKKNMIHHCTYDNNYFAQDQNKNSNDIGN